MFVNRHKWGLHRLSSLNHLELSGCRNAVESFPEDGLLPSNLSRLRIDGFRSLRSLDGPGLRRLTSLRQLSICGCGSLGGIPDEGLPASLSCLRIVQCDLLSRRCQRDVGEDWDSPSFLFIIARFNQCLIGGKWQFLKL